MKGRPPSRHSFPCMFLHSLHEDVQKRPKHVVDEKLMCSVLKVVYALTHTDMKRKWFHSSCYVFSLKISLDRVASCVIFISDLCQFSYESRHLTVNITK